MKHFTRILISISVYLDLYQVISLPSSSVPKEGDLRLHSINGFRTSEAGNVLIYHNGRWGAICDDGWTLNNANVACNMLGYPGAIGHSKQAYFGIPTEDFWLDNVQCFGDEKSLTECTHLDWGKHNCVLREAAGVFCTPKAEEDTPPVSSPHIPSTSPLPDTVTQKQQITSTQQSHNVVRLVQGPVYHVHEQETQSPERPQRQNIDPHAYHTNPPTQYHVESTTQSHPETERHPERPVRPHDNDNHDGVHNNEVRPPPRTEHHHGHSSNQPSTVAPYLPPPIVDPHPNEADILQNDAVIDAILTMEDKVVIGEESKDQPPKYDIHNPPRYKLRLVGGRNTQEGRVEVNLGGHWGTICSDGWDLREANVACRQLGLSHASNAYGAHFFGGVDEDKLIAGLECDGHETRLSDCFHQQIGQVMCPQKNFVAGVICTESLPDLVPNATLLEHSIYLQDRAMYYLQCAMEEGCASSSAYVIKDQSRNWFTHTRRLLRFSSSTWNFGTADFRPFLRKEDWEWHLCHMHYHSMEVFAVYDLLDTHGNKVAEGHKASFCLEDVQCLPGRQKRYRCLGFGDQGISVGCADDYLHDIDCQWIDVSDVKPGEYIFQVHINPGFNVAELNFDNNLAQCDLSYTGNAVRVRNCVIVNDKINGN